MPEFIVYEKTESANLYIFEAPSMEAAREIYLKQIAADEPIDVVVTYTADEIYPTGDIVIEGDGARKEFNIEDPAPGAELSMYEFLSWFGRRQGLQWLIDSWARLTHEEVKDSPRMRAEWVRIAESCDVNIVT